MQTLPHLRRFCFWSAKMSIEMQLKKWWESVLVFRFIVTSSSNLGSLLECNPKLFFPFGVNISVSVRADCRNKKSQKLPRNFSLFFWKQGNRMNLPLIANFPVQKNETKAPSCTIRCLLSGQKAAYKWSHRFSELFWRFYRLASIDMNTQ